jgi:hypothetical protein
MNKNIASTAFISGLLTVTLCITIATINTPAQAQTTSVGPYYAMPSWDQTLPSATRFIVLSNFSSAAVLDRNTGLVWERSPSTDSTTWPLARISCVNKTVGGQRGWRLPSAVEIMSLQDRSIINSQLPPGHPFTVNNPVGSYWTATTVVPPTVSSPVSGDTLGAVWVYLFGSGVVAESSRQPTVTNLSWCVRGPMNADAY